MKKSRIKPLSDKKKEELKNEVPIREELCRRCGGVFIFDGVTGYCRGGYCELCHNPPRWLPLSPHEIKFRSAGGKLSLDNSIMLCYTCHGKAHGLAIKED